MKKGLETMETRENYLPGQMYLSFGGSEGLKGEPMSLVEGRSDRAESFDSCL